MGKLQLIVFDWDGTLADSVPLIIKCKLFLAQEYKIEKPPTPETIKSVLGEDFKTAMSICFPETSEETLSEIKADFKRLMQTGEYQADLFIGVRGILNQLKEVGIKLAIATSKSRLELTTALKHTRLDEFFDYTCCAEEYQSKPHPAMLAHLLEHFSLSSDDCLMVGDALADIQFAKNAEVPIICVTFGAGLKEALVELSPLGLIDQWNDFLPMLKHKFNDLPHQEEIVVNSIFPGNSDPEEHKDARNYKKALNENSSMFNLS